MVFRNHRLLGWNAFSGGTPPLQKECRLSQQLANEQQLLCCIVLWHGVKYRMWAVRYWVSCGLVLKVSYWHFPYHYLVKAMCFKFHQWWLDWPGCHLRDLGCVYTAHALQGIQNVQWIRRIFPLPLIWNNKKQLRFQRGVLASSSWGLGFRNDKGFIVI